MGTRKRQAEDGFARRLHAFAPMGTGRCAAAEFSGRFPGKVNLEEPDGPGWMAIAGWQPRRFAASRNRARNGRFRRETRAEEIGRVGGRARPHGARVANSVPIPTGPSSAPSGAANHSPGLEPRGTSFDAKAPAGRKKRR